MGLWVGVLVGWCVGGSVPDACGRTASIWQLNLIFIIPGTAGAAAALAGQTAAVCVVTVFSNEIGTNWEGGAGPSSLST